ncbi:MAG: yibF [Burkholderiaceae bacterium]|nr:yibF [Burkholderiaceae bacterium]
MLTLKLIGSYTSPYVRKIRIMLAKKNIPYEFILDDVWSAQPQVLAFNPLGQIPCILLPTGEILTDSRSIAEYLDWLVPAPALATIAQRLAVLKWQAIAEGIIDTSVKYRIEQIRPAALQWQDWFARQKDKLRRCFAILDAHLERHTWLANDQYSVADLTLQCALNFIDFRMGDWDWRAEFANLKRFETQLANQAAYIETMPR